MFFEILPLNIQLGLLAGFAVAAAGYFQECSKGEKAEKFSIDKFTITVIIGGIIGALMTFFSEIDSAITLFLVNIGIITIISSFVKSILRMSI
jgi:prolipoprotein diacylglyceryltransferase